MSNVTTETLDPVTDAAGTLAAAEGHLAEVNRRIDSGDPTVVADDLLRAETEVRIARARLEVAERQAQAKAEQERRDRLGAIRKEVAEKVNPDALAPHAKKLEAALEAWVLACREYEDTRTELWNELTVLGFTVSPGEPIDRPAPIQHTIRQAATEAIRKHFPRMDVDLNRN